MGIRLVYGLKTDDNSYLDIFYPSRRLAEAAHKIGLDYDATIHGPGTSMAATTAFCNGHVALLRGELSIRLYEHLEAAGTLVVNGAAATARAADKLRTSERCTELGIAHPRTFLIDLNDTTLPLEIPFVAKPRFGKMGRGVFLVESAGAWQAFMKSGEAASSPYIAQEYIAASRGRDVRFFFARFGEDCEAPKPVVVQRNGTGLASNAHAGGIMAPFEPPDFLQTEAKRIFVDSGLVYGTVDFLFEDEGGSSFVLCETNACPGFEALENTTGLDVAKAILLSALAAEGTS